MKMVVRRGLGPLAIAILGVCGGYFLGGYDAYVLGIWFIYALAGLGLTFAVGWVGEISVGHAGIMAVGAYAAAELANGNVVGGLLIGIASGLVTGFIVGLPTIRVRGFGLAIVTLAFVELVGAVISNVPQLGGASGIFLTIPALFGTPADLPMLVVISGVILAAGIVIAGVLRDSTLGKSWRAVRDNEPLARALGINPALMRVTAFAISGAYCGVAGALLSWMLQYLSPDSFDLLLSINLLAIVVIGGKDELYGSLLGAGLLTVGGEVLRVTAAVQGVAFGLALLIVVWLLPQGLVPALVGPIRRRLRASERMGTRGAASSNAMATELPSSAPTAADK